MPSRKVLRRAARRLDAAMASALDAGARLARGDPGGDGRVLRRALADSWAVQARVLVEFLQPGADAPGDRVAAAHFVPDPALRRRALPRLTTRERRRLSRLEALAAPVRVRRRRPPAWRERDHRLLERRIRAFLAVLPPRRRRWFPETARRLASQMDWVDLVETGGVTR